MPPSPRRPRAPLYVEELESRRLLAAPSVAEQVFLERLNDARANPTAYGNAIGLNLAGVAASQPLAFDPRLIDGARGHSQDMSVRNYFGHTGSDGSDPGRRMTAAGFPWTGWGESIAAGYPTPEEALKGLIIDAGIADLGHRRHLLAMDPVFQGQRAVGVGVVQNGIGSYHDYYTIDSASDADGRPYLTGVVYNDLNHNGVYDAGEGLGGVPVTVPGVGTVTTWDAGGYSLRVAPGTYTVTASGGPWGGPVSQTVAVGSANVRVNFNPGPVATSAFVTKLYQRVLGRTPSAGEANFWVSFGQGQGPAALSSAIERSGEARGRLVRTWYTTYLGRSAGPAEQNFWVNALLGGATEEQALTAILGSAEYWARAAAQNGGGDAGAIRGLYKQILGRDAGAGAGEVAYWMSQLPALGGAGVAWVMVQSPEFRAAQVQSYYQTLFRRAAGGGAAFWAASTYDLTSLRVVLETSPEFING